ncbi:unnamed protein product [Prorocentrum cordatum]|uniref:B box-type domain-containing protein n=1 Tax=Prorocentrum cordatum TaxID=2364126 RepID=A0ABN9UDH1_9DINO|nr:unnamed protein product [Polarella glacialis]
MRKVCPEGGERGSRWQRDESAVRASAPQAAGEELRAADGAPRCAGGHPTLATSSSEGRYAGGWRCTTCGCQKRGERWFCSLCQDNLCFGCWPRYERGAAAQKEAIFVEGRHVQVKKHSSMGCAVVTFRAKATRDQAIARLSADPPVLGGIRLDVKAHRQKQPDGSQEEMPLCAFVGWKRAKAEGLCRLLAGTLQVYLDRVCDRFSAVIDVDD